MSPKRGEPAPKQVVFAGMPRTGKTTYLALVYYAISTARATNIGLGRFSDDREYLNRVSKKLLACEEALHTEIEERGQLLLSLEIGKDRSPAVLQIPDLSGETWEHALYEREWSKAIDHLARSASGVLLFVHVTGFNWGPSIASVRSADDALRALDSDDTEAMSQVSEFENEAQRRYQPTQVQIVDLLQLLCEERARRPARAGIVLSAWDLADSGTTPLEWLRLNAPLVFQYLNANRSWLSASVWGVSAQGGSFRGEARTEMLLKDPIERAQVIEGGGIRRAVEDPIKWLLQVTDS